MLSITTIIIILVFILTTFSTFLNNKSKSTNPHPLPPGPTPLPFIGCIIQMLLNQPAFRWIHKLMDEFDTPILCVRLGPSTHVIAVSSPDLACEFLKKQDDIFMSRPDFLSTYQVTDGFQTGGFSPSGEQRRKMKRVLSREILSPAMHKWLQPKRDEEADRLLRYIFNQVMKQGGGLINIRTVTQHFVGNMLRNFIFGKRLFGQGMEDGGPSVEDTEHVVALFTIIKYIYAFCVTDYLPWLRTKTDFDGHEKNTRISLEIVRKYQDGLIDQRIQMWENGGRKEKCDLLDVFVTHENPKLTPDEIKAQVVEIMIAAIDNPTNAVEWTIGEMINEPMILKRATEELDHVVGQHRLVEERDIPQLNYIKACIKEAFRLHPFAAFVPPHVSTMNTFVAGYFIPKGSHVLLSRSRIGRYPNVWADPLRFNPDRHLYGQQKNVNLSDDELRVLSFSTGKRGCPAVTMGSTITTMLLARMVQGFNWEAPNNQRFVDLMENQNDLFLAKPLVAVARARLPLHMYPTF